MVSIRDYAKTKGVSYEAVRKQVNRYKAELGEHIVKVGKKQYLDESAVAFLDERRAESPVIIVETGKDERIGQLEAENRALLLKVAELQEALIKEKDKVQLLQSEKIELLEDKNKKVEKKWWQRLK